MNSTDVAIIGAGPLGIELAVAIKRAGISYIHFEAKQIGQTMSWWPAQTRWFSSNERIAIAGVPLQTPDQLKCTREQYLAYLRSVVQQFDLQINSYEPVVAIEKASDDFLLRTKPAGGSREYRAKHVVLVTGGTASARRLNVPGEDLPHVSHYFEDPHKYFRRRVLIVGGKNSAVEAAIRCQLAGAQVTLSYRREEFNAKSIKYWLYPEIMSLIRSGQIRAHFNTVVTNIDSAAVELAAVDNASSLFARAPSRFKVPADFVLLLTGYIADMSLARLAGVTLTAESEIPTYDERTMQTNVPGLYIAGTAVAGTQDRYKVFLENCHIHVDRIVASLTGAVPPAAPAPISQPES